MVGKLRGSGDSCSCSRTVASVCGHMVVNSGRWAEYRGGYRSNTFERVGVGSRISYQCHSSVEKFFSEAFNIFKQYDEMSDDADK